MNKIICKHKYRVYTGIQYNQNALKIHKLKPEKGGLVNSVFKLTLNTSFMLYICYMMSKNNIGPMLAFGWHLLIYEFFQTCLQTSLSSQHPITIRHAVMPFMVGIHRKKMLAF